jgi:hypothetical protein
VADTEQAATTFVENVSAIGQKLSKLHDENRRMRMLLAQAALFVAMQPENRFRNKWLKEVEEVTEHV